MANIIRLRLGKGLNPINKWPTNGFYTRDHYHQNDIIVRQWCHLDVDDVQTLIGNAFEQTDMTMLTVMITARRHYSVRTTPYLDVRIENVQQEELPIESMDRHMLSEHLKYKIDQALLVSDVTTFTIRCHVKGWFW